MTEGQALRLLRVAGSAVLVIFIAFLFVNPRRAVTENTPGFTDPIAGIELASRPAHVFGILGTPGAPERPEAVRRMVLGTRLDFLFLVAYPALHLGVAWLLIARGAVPGPMRIALLVLPFVMAFGDAMENRQILALTRMVDAAPMEPVLARLRLFTTLKWGALYLDSALLAALIVRERGWWRWTALPFGIAAGLGIVALVHPPAIEWSIAPLGLAYVSTYARAFGRPGTS